MAEKTIPIRFEREELILIQDALDLMEPTDSGDIAFLSEVKNKLDMLWMEAWTE